MNYQDHYDRLMERARDRILDGYCEKHHVQPKCLGGTDEQFNLVLLTPEEHYTAHQLLAKMQPNHIGLVWAAVKMTQGNRKTKRSNKLYGWLRRRYSILAKNRNGSQNSSYGTRWIVNPVTTEAVKIKKDSPIPNGWEIGRVPQNKCCVCGVRCKKSRYCFFHAREARAAQCRMNGMRGDKTGLIYINNGIEQRRHNPSNPMPHGFVNGGLPRARRKKES